MRNILPILPLRPKTLRGGTSFRQKRASARSSGSLSSSIWSGCWVSDPQLQPFPSACPKQKRIWRKRTDLLQQPRPKKSRQRLCNSFIHSNQGSINHLEVAMLRGGHFFERSHAFETY